MTEDPYLYPGTKVLRNKLDIRDAAELEYIEREFVILRTRQGTPTGDFDLAHLQAIHQHLFQDVYDWAGQTRTLEIAKGRNQFQLHAYIGTGMADVHRRLQADSYLRGLSPADFTMKAAQIIGDVNYVHPFREGNGRTQLQYLEQLAVQAGHPLDLTKLDREQWLHASREAHYARYQPMANALDVTLVRDLGREPPDRSRSR
jgi:cell filamentation protein